MDRMRRARRRQLRRLRIEIQRRLSLLAVEATVGQDRPACLKAMTDMTVLAPVQAAYLEQIGEIAVEKYAQAQIDCVIAVIADRNPVIGGIAPEKNRAHDVLRVLGED